MCHLPFPRVTNEPSSVLLAGFDLWPGSSGWSRRMAEAVGATAHRHPVLTFSIRAPSLPHTEFLLGARALRVPPGSGGLLDQVETFGRAVQRQLDAEPPGLVHTADPLVGAAVLAHPRRPILLYEARRLPSSELPLLCARGQEAQVLEPALRRWERHCVLEAHGVVVTTRARADEVRALGRKGPLHLVPDGVEPADLRPPGSAPLRIRHVGWDLSVGALRILLAMVREAGPEIRLHLVQPRGAPWASSLQREVSAAARTGALTVGRPGALPAGWAEVELLPGIDPESAAPAVLADALEGFARGCTALAADSDAARADLPAGCTVFFPRGDAQALAAAVRTLAGAPDLLGQSAAEARSYVVRRHDAARVRGLLRDLYRRHGVVHAAGRTSPRPSMPAAPPPWSGSSPGGRAVESTDPGTPTGRFG